ncbi:MAG: hypothetical protein ABW224_11225 [Kibdelosporangium sp.]
MWTRRLRVLVVWCSVVFTVGTALHGFVIIDVGVIERMMTLAGADPAEAPGFLAGFRMVGAVFVVGNALGLLALRGWPWLFWVVLAVNAGQAAGVVLVPWVMFEAVVAEYGWAGVLPSVVTDGGALVLVLVMLGRVSARARRRGGSARPSALPGR